MTKTTESRITYLLRRACLRIKVPARVLQGGTSQRHALRRAGALFSSGGHGCTFHTNAFFSSNELKSFKKRNFDTLISVRFFLQRLRVFPAFLKGKEISREIRKQNGNPPNDQWQALICLSKYLTFIFRRFLVGRGCLMDCRRLIFGSCHEARRFQLFQLQGEEFPELGKFSHLFLHLLVGLNGFVSLPLI